MNPHEQQPSLTERVTSLSQMARELSRETQALKNDDAHLSDAEYQALITYWGLIGHIGARMVDETISQQMDAAAKTATQSMSITPRAEQAPVVDLPHRGHQPKPTPFMPQTTTATPEVTSEIRNKRHIAIATAVRACRNHPQVRQAFTDRLTEPIVYKNTEDSFLYLVAQAGIFSKISDEEAASLFATIENGYTSCEKLVERPEELSVDDKQQLIEVTIAHDTLFFASLRRVTHFATKYSHRMSPADLFQYGCEGLAKAIKQPFNPDIGRAGAFITSYIDGVILAALSRASVVSTTASDHQYMPEVRRTAQELYEKLNRTPTAQEISLHTESKLSEAQVVEFLRGIKAQETVSFDLPIGTNGTMTLGDLLGAPDPALEALFEQDDASPIEKPPEKLRDLMALADLSDKEKFIVGMRHNLNPDTLPGLTMTNKHGTFDYAILADMHGRYGLSIEKIAIILGYKNRATYTLNTYQRAMLKLQMVAVHDD